MRQDKCSEASDWSETWEDSQPGGTGAADDDRGQQTVAFCSVMFLWETVQEPGAVLLATPASRQGSSHRHSYIASASFLSSSDLNHPVFCAVVWCLVCHAVKASLQLLAFCAFVTSCISFSTPYLVDLRSAAAIRANSSLHFRSVLKLLLILDHSRGSAAVDDQCVVVSLLPVTLRLFRLPQHRNTCKTTLSFCQTRTRERVQVSRH